MPAFLDLIGQRFNRLTVLERGENAPCGHVRWKCRCDCGTEVLVSSMNLRTGQSGSCGCLKSEIISKVTTERNKTHGNSFRGKRSKAYIAWVNMIQRCTNPNATKFDEYGGRGIKVCARWRDSFRAFIKDMGEPPSPHHSIDRQDNDGDYTPKNCRWAIEAVQMNNTSANRKIEHAGRVLTLQEWSRETGIPRKTISNRLDRLSWSVAEALTVKPSPLPKDAR